MIVSISGMDNAGKTTQCNMLRSKYPEVFSEPMHIKDSPSFDETKHDETWWFRSDNAEEFTEVIYKCLLERIELAEKVKSKIVLLDKGADFYDSRIIATLIMKGLKYNEAKKYSFDIKMKYFTSCREDLKLYLESGTYKRKELNLTSFEDLRYNTYLELNKLILARANTRYINIPTGDIEVVNDSILESIEDIYGDIRTSSSSKILRAGTTNEKK